MRSHSNLFSFLTKNKNSPQERRVNYIIIY
nr:MAG TPA: hypothetical protein [Caudoviricetes sp.]DAN25105.1 MAG TPA: hypothetical protein [Caudoviricetes sp.]DAT99536.1 MAG TPA: hypothetical protein [Caudoviricetes sp.]